MTIDKARLFQQLLSKLNDSLLTTIEAADNAKTLATHEQSKPETQYDTVGLEASYLAHGQSQRVYDLETAIKDWQQLTHKTFDDESLVTAGALISLSNSQAEHKFFLLGNYNGGLKLTHQGIEVTVVSIDSPIGKQLFGQTLGAEINFPLDSKAIVEISTIL